MPVQPADLKAIPLFADIADEELRALISAFRSETFEPGHVLFEAGAKPTRFLILTGGALSTRDGGTEVFEIRPPAPVGELGSLTGELRNLTCVVTERATLLVADLDDLQGFLEEHGAVAFAFHRNLLRLSARKIGRDRRRQREMRENIISTQKAMKRMREALLESEDNPLHAALFEQLDALIEQNRKVHYLVEPSRLVPTHIRLDGGTTHRVTAISNEWVYFCDPPETLSHGQELSGVLLLDKKEIAVSGALERLGENEAAIFLDELIEEYDETLTRHLTRAQLLDVVL